jgi:HAD superfamily hydrolase (TIGR01509 family)
MSFYDMRPVVEAHLQRTLPAEWEDDLVVQVTTALGAEVETVPGARQALLAVTALGLAWRIASNSSHIEMAAKFRRTELTDLVTGRIHSVVDLIATGGRGKPAPDIFLAASMAECVDPAACIVIEDSVAGVRGAIAAGMDCLGFSPDGDGGRLRAEGALPFHALEDLPDLLRAALQVTP